MTRGVRAACVFLVFIGVLLVGGGVLMKIFNPSFSWGDLMRSLATAGFCFWSVRQVRQGAKEALVGETPVPGEE